ncbi:MAG: tetratricopeptide repeat protein [Deltaproteobacteria bacterium]|nr:tetratricopeptide repeat protein [Deltaproteobacteria bacterium]
MAVLRGCVAGVVALLASGALPAAEEAPAPPRSPYSGRGVVRERTAYTAEEQEELQALQDTVLKFEKYATEYRQATRGLIEAKYKEKRDKLFSSYEAAIVKLEGEQRRRRDAAIAKFEEFLRKHPGDPRYSSDAMFRLSELYFERSYDVYFQARQAYDKAIESVKPDAALGAEPVEPVYHYEPTIGMMQRLITEFPEYRLIDGAYYLLGFCLGEQGEEERAADVYLELVGRYPKSKFAPEVWTRIGEYYFGANELQLALEAYTQVLGHPDSPFYDKAMYKLAWTHYRLADPERAPQEFQKSIDTFVELLDFNERSKSEGKERGGELRKESAQYIAISYADENWGSLKKALDYFEAKNHPPYEREILTALGDVYFDQTRFDDAIRTYSEVQQRFPDDLEAPQVQQKIVNAHERNRDFEGAAHARTVLADSYVEGGSWFAKYKDDDRAVKDATELVQKSLYTAALFHHKQAQTYKQDNKTELATNEYRKAAEAYGGYLRRFPHDRQLYELTYFYAEALYYSLQFTDAAREYAKVRDSNEDDKYLEPAAFSVVLSYQRMLEAAEKSGELPPLKLMKSTERDSAVAITPQELPPMRAGLIDASDKYAAAAPNSEQVPKVLYKAAEIYYAYDHLEEARRRFQGILEGYPSNEVAEFAANWVVESYLAEKNFRLVEEFSRGLLSRPAVPGKKQFKSDLVKFKTGAMFKIAEDMDQKGEFEKAAELYLQLLDENPTTQFADSAINNAAVNYEKVRRYESASKLYERLVAQHPKSPLADNALFRVGLNAERFFDFERAITAYTKLVDGYPKSERRADALYNEALSLENTKDYERAAKEYLRYCTLFSKRKDAPEVCFKAGLVYEKMGDRKRLVSTYEDYIRKFKGNATYADKVIHAYLKIAQTYDKQEQNAQAQKYYDLTVKTYARAGAKSSAGVYAAEAEFQMVEQKAAAFRKLEIAGNGKQQMAALSKKAEQLKKVEAAYMGVLKFKQIDWTLAALFRIGQLYQNMADTIMKSPCPPDVKAQARKLGVPVDEICTEYRVAIEEKAGTVEDKAVQAYETTINRAREFQVANTWTKQTLVALNKLRRKAWPLQKDAKSYVEEVVVGPPPTVDLQGAVVAPVRAAPAPKESDADATLEAAPAPETKAPAKAAAALAGDENKASSPAPAPSDPATPPVTMPAALETPPPPRDPTTTEPPPPPPLPPPPKR